MGRHTPTITIPSFTSGLGPHATRVPFAGLHAHDALSRHQMCVGDTVRVYVYTCMCVHARCGVCEIECVHICVRAVLCGVCDGEG